MPIAASWRRRRCAVRQRRRLRLSSRALAASCPVSRSHRRLQTRVIRSGFPAASPKRLSLRLIPAIGCRRSRKNWLHARRRSRRRRPGLRSWRRASVTCRNCSRCAAVRWLSCSNRRRRRRLQPRLRPRLRLLPPRHQRRWCKHRSRCLPPRPRLQRRRLQRKPLPRLRWRQQRPKRRASQSQRRRRPSAQFADPLRPRFRPSRPWWSR